MFSIRPMQPTDWPSVWTIIKPVFRAGETYLVDPEISEQKAHTMWVDAPQVTYVAQDNNGVILGTFFIKANQPGHGSHVANCGYIVSAEARGRGIASALCQHSQQEAQRLGFRAMQFNSVVSTNEVAVRLWQKLGFEIVGTLPGAFRHPHHGFVDLFVMYKQLVEG